MTGKIAAAARAGGILTGIPRAWGFRSFRLLPWGNAACCRERRSQTVLRTADLDYHLPPELIATRPAEPRDSARLLVLRRGPSSKIEHRTIRDLPGLLRSGDCLVFNTSRVLPARFRGVREGTGGRVEGLYLHDSPRGPEGPCWVVLVDAGRPRPGARLKIHDPSGAESGVDLVLVERSADEPGAWIASVHAPAGLDSPRILERIGTTPLPPYILRARRAAGLAEDERSDRERYQTVYADPPGSVAAPTAGLHFTPELLASLTAAGISRADAVLHVGVGTFRPIEAEYVEGHPMHAEWCSLQPGALTHLIRTRERDGRVVCVGTTTARTIESYAAIAGPEISARLQTRLLITPGYRWQYTDALLTNFHLPRSTLMALVAAMLPGGVEQLKAAYAEAVAERYRFYSYGDAMLVL